MFLEQCRLLVAASERAQEVAEQASAGLAGILRIGAVTSAFSEALPADPPPLPGIAPPG